MTTEISNTDDIIDSRDVIARIEELEGEDLALREDIDSATEEFEESDEDDELEALRALQAAETALMDWMAEEGQELEILRNLASDAEDYAPDWAHGAALIRDSYFETYAQELAEDIGAVDSNASWPNTCIDWEQAAHELQMDYTSVDFDGVTYWIR